MPDLFDDLNPPQRRLMGPGPVDADPRILRAMSMPLLGQFDPAFTGYMNEVMVLYRQAAAYRESLDLSDRWHRKSRDRGRLGFLDQSRGSRLGAYFRLASVIWRPEIATRCRADVRTIEVEWGQVSSPRR